MKITFKKALAITAMFGLLGGVALNVNAAAITIDSVVYNDGTDTITVTDAGKNYSSDNITTLRVTDENAVTIAGVDVSDVSANNNGSFVVTDLINLDGLTSGIYSVAFITASGDFSSATFTIGTADQIVVSANVLPILSMKVTGGAVAFGDLVADTATTAGTTTTISVNTNAASGYNMQVANSGLIDGSNTIPAATANENLSTGYGYGINATVNAGATVDSVASAGWTIANAFLGVDNTNVSGMGGAATLSSSTGPVSAQNTVVTYYTRISSLQATGNYTDTITYSITGSF